MLGSLAPGSGNADTAVGSGVWALFVLLLFLGFFIFIIVFSLIQSIYSQSAYPYGNLTIVFNTIRAPNYQNG